MICLLCLFGLHWLCYKGCDDCWMELNGCWCNKKRKLLEPEK